jgi:flagellar biosynthesis GTPase FlhF
LSSIPKAEKTVAAQARRDENKRKKEQDAAEKAHRKEQDKALKQQEKANKEREKIEKAQMKLANKLVNNKKNELSDVTIVFSQSFNRNHRQLRDAFHAFMLEHETDIFYEASLMEGYDTIRWRTSWNKSYNPDTREWVPKERYTREENVALLYISAAKVLELSRRNEMKGVIDGFRKAHRLFGPKDQVHLMYHGLSQYRLTKDREEIFEALVTLQYECNNCIHLHQVCS